MELPAEAFSDSGRLRARWRNLLASLGLRYCSSCKTIQPASNFSSREGTGLQPHCVFCVRKRAYEVFGEELPEVSEEELAEAKRSALEKAELTRENYEKTMNRLGYHRCERCGEQFHPFGMMTRTLCLDCARAIVEELAD